MSELIDTEQSYVQDLGYVVKVRRNDNWIFLKVFMRPPQEAIKKSKGEGGVT